VRYPRKVRSGLGDVLRMAQWLVALTSLIVCVAPPANAGPPGRRLSAPAFYDQAAPTIATVEFVQEFVSGGQRQQTRSWVDGVVISDDGLVLISGRVRFPQRSKGRLAGGSLPQLVSFSLHFADGREHQAEVVAFDDDLNLGVLRITDAEAGQTFPHVRFRDSFKGEIGAGLRTMTLYTESYGRTPVLGAATITAKLKTLDNVWSLSGVSTNLLGAPLWDERGAVVGVVAQVPMSPWAGRQLMPDLSGTIGLPHGHFADFLAACRQEDSRAPTKGSEPTVDKGEAGWLGVMFEPLGRKLAEHLGISPGGGVVLSRVVPGSPAEAAGLQALDILVEMDGDRIDVESESDSAPFAQKIRTYSPGQVVRFVRERASGQRSEVAVTLTQAPTSELHAERREDEAFELTVRELTLDTRLAHRLEPGATGVVVDGVTRAGWSGLAGLKRGMIIQRINKLEVTDLDSFTDAMSRVQQTTPAKVLFFVRFGKTTRFHVAEPDWTEGQDGNGG